MYIKLGFMSSCGGSQMVVSFQKVELSSIPMFYHFLMMTT